MVMNMDQCQQNFYFEVGFPQLFEAGWEHVALECSLCYGMKRPNVAKVGCKEKVRHIVVNIVSDVIMVIIIIHFLRHCRDQQ